jgi:hypothetical protein
MLAWLLLAAAGCTAVPPGPGPAATGPGNAIVGRVQVAGGPSAWQIAHGRWVRIPPGPIKACDAAPVWDGRDLVMVEPGFPPCGPAAALYDPVTNRWTRIAAPPKVVGPAPVIAWGGGQLLLVAWRTGAAAAWISATGRWRSLPPLPARDVVSANWTGREFLVFTARRLAANKGIAQVFGLHGDRWARLPDLPQPRRGQVVSVATATFGGSVYALAGVGVWHLDPNDTYNVEYSELLRLKRSAWERVPLPSGVPQSQQALIRVAGALVALGSACPSSFCTLEDGAAALVMPGTRASVIPLRPRAGVPYPRDIAAGGHAIVVVYSEGLGDLAVPGYGAAPGSTAIYDTATRTWLNGPTAPETRADRSSAPAAIWTPFGVISISQEPGGGVASGHPGGWLLRPWTSQR